MNKEQFYFSKDNLELLYNILKTDINDKFKYNLDLEENFYKTQLFHIMNGIFLNNKNKELNEINTLVLKEIAPIFANKINDKVFQKNTIRDSDIINRSKDLIKQTSVDMRPQSSLENNNLDLDNKLDNLRNTRNEFNNNPKLIPDDFRLPIEEENNIEDLENEFKKRNHEFNTNNTIPQPNNQINSSQSNMNQVVVGSQTSINKINSFQTSMVPIIEEQLEEEMELVKTDALKTHSNSQNISYIDKRNQEEIEMINNNKYASPNDLYVKNMEKNTELDKLYQQKMNTKENTMDLLIPDQDIKYIKSTNLLSISSIDRKWWENEDSNRYNYSIYFNPSNNTYEKKAIYENNETIPQNNQQYEKGILGDLNLNGWTSSNGTVYLKYDPNKPKGNIVGYDTILIQGNQNLKIDTIFRNIYSIELVNIYLPIENIIITPDDSININIYSFPYLLLYIEEFTNIYSSTNNIIDNCFCVLTIDETINASDIDYRGYVLCIPNAGEKKIFSPKPLDSLTKLSIQILTPQGELLNQEKDVHKITKINISDPTSGVNANLLNKQFYINIECQEYFNNNLIQKMDLLYYKQIKINHNIFSNDMELRDIRDDFISYLERDTGHYIYYLGNLNNYNYTNTWYLNNNVSLDKSSGDYTLNNYNSNQAKVLEFFTILETSNVSGYAINYTLQNNVTFNIKTRTIDMNYSM